MEINMHYVIGDVHGCFDEMITLIKKIESADSDARFVFVGDFFDRGPKVWDVLMWAMENITPDGKYQSVMGNHELYALYWYKDFRKWETTVYPKTKSLDDLPKAQYDLHIWAGRMNALSSEKLLPILRFFLNLPFEKQFVMQGRDGKTIRYRIVHAWVPGPEDDTPEKQQAVYLFDRHFTGNTENDDIIVCGHTPTCSPVFYEQDKTTRPGMISYRKNAIHIDCGCSYKPYFNEYPCMLGAICLETLEEIYPCSLKERMVVSPDALDEPWKANAALYKLKYLLKKNRYREEMLKRL